MIETDYYVLYDNCADFQNAIDRAYTLIRDNYDIIEGWFDAQGRKGKAFGRHFNGKTRTRIKCKDFKNESLDGRGVPTGMELRKSLLEDYEFRRPATATDGQTCLDIDLAAVILHETHHLCWRGGERTAWSLEAWWRAKITDRLGLAGAQYCNHPVTVFPADGKYNLKLKRIKELVQGYMES